MLVTNDLSLTYIDIIIKTSINSIVFRRFETELVDVPLFRTLPLGKDNELRDYPFGSYIYKDNEGRKIIYSLDHETLEYSIENYEMIETVAGHSTN